MCPSSAHDPTAEAEAPAEERDDQAKDQAQDQAPATDEGTGQGDDGDGDRDGDRDGDGGGEGRPNEPVDVAPDPDQTGIDVDKPERIEEMDEDEIEQIRQERLDPDNRPENAEVDNTQRDFDTVRGKFEDSDIEPPTGPFDDPENPNQPESDAEDENED